VVGSARCRWAGRGIEMDEAAVERAAEIGHDWHNPLFSRNDGSCTGWWSSRLGTLRP